MFSDGLGPPEFSAFEKYAIYADRVRREDEYRECLRGLLSQNGEALAADLNDLLPQNYKRWGEAGALVVDMALREVPPIGLSLGRRILKLGRNVNDFEWPRDMFAVPIPPLEPSQKTEESDEGESDAHESFSAQAETMELENTIAAMDIQERTVIAANMFAVARRTILHPTKPTLMHWKGKGIKFDLITKAATGYQHLLDYAKPFTFRNPTVLQAYNDGFAEKAEELGFPNLTARHGFEILRRAPRKLHAIKIGEDPEKTRARVFTQHGALLTLHKVDNNQWQLPTSMESIWERTRARTPSSPDAVALFALHLTVHERVQALLTANIPVLAAAPPRD